MILLCPVTFLVFFAAVAGTFFIPAYLGASVTNHILSFLTGCTGTCRGMFRIPVGSRHYFLALARSTPLVETGTVVQ